MKRAGRVVISVSVLNVGRVSVKIFVRAWFVVAVAISGGFGGGFGRGLGVGFGGGVVCIVPGL